MHVTSMQSFNTIGHVLKEKKTMDDGQWVITKAHLKDIVLSWDLNVPSINKRHLPWFPLVQRAAESVQVRSWRTWTWTFPPTWKFWSSSVVKNQSVSISWNAAWTIVRTGRATCRPLWLCGGSPSRSKRSTLDHDICMRMASDPVWEAAAPTRHTPYSLLVYPLE